MSKRAEVLIICGDLSLLFCYSIYTGLILVLPMMLFAILVIGGTTPVSMLIFIGVIVLAVFLYTATRWQLSFIKRVKEGTVPTSSSTYYNNCTSATIIWALAIVPLILIGSWAWLFVQGCAASIVFYFAYLPYWDKDI